MFGFLENLRDNVRENRKEKKKKKKKTGMKIKNRYKVNKLFLYVFLNSFYLFSTII